MQDTIQKIVSLLFQVDHSMHEQLRDAEAKAPLSIPELMALLYIKREGPVSITQMADHFSVRKSSMSTKISKLERLGLITRDSCKFDKRSHSISITEKAISLLKETKQYVATHATPLFAKLTDAEKQTFITLLTKITK